jgi:histidinol-phosphate aminotransferase
MKNAIAEQRGLKPIRPYVPGKPTEEVEREYGLSDIIKLASNENPIGTSPMALSAIRDALPKINFYPDGRGYNLCQALAAHLGVDFEQVMVGNGIDGLIVQLCLAYLDEDCEVIASCSSFPVYDIYVHAMRATLVKTPLKRYGLDLEAMAEAISGRTKIAFVCNPNNPTGTIVTAAEVEAFMAKVPEHVLVVFDEAYYEFVASNEFPHTLRYIQQDRQNVVILRTFSKIYGLAGIRLGYAIAAPGIFAAMYKVKEPFAVNLLAQAAGIAALKDDTFLRRSVSENDEGRQYLYAQFRRLGLEYVESHTNFVLVKIGPEAADIQKHLLERGVIVRPCMGYDLPEFLRITVGNEPENTRFIRALEDILRESKPLP